MAKPRSERKQQISVLLSAEQLAGLQTLSERTLAPINALVRAAVDNYLELRKRELQ